MAWLLFYLLKMLEKTWLSISRSFTGGRSGLIVMRISPISTTSFSMPMFWNYTMVFLRLRMSSTMVGLMARLLPMMSGHRVFLLAGGRPCFHKDYRMLVLMLSPL